MDNKENLIDNEKNIIGNNLSFDDDINEINGISKNKTSQDNNNNERFSKREQNIFFNEIFKNKYFENADFEEIFEILNEIDQAVIINANKKNKKDYYNKNKKRSNSDKKNNKVKKENHFKECKEILCILRKPMSNKNVTNIMDNNNPFKPLLKPKKISLVGKILNVPSDEISTQNSSKDNNSNSNNNNNL